MTIGLLALAMGVLLFWAGWNHWRHRREETVNILEGAILDATGAEPLPLTKLDWFLKYLQAILSFVFGFLFTLMGAVIILYELEML
ncbi:protein of unknown function [uncultured Sphingopyxis sp.]|uniref:Uncharacterized protein n=1 Tax=uncultured Sphingopyxis sp. TaxID=310581 RepID=A0A1Y5Q561_9SPHN|nr:hypothetical protein [uncultured Sphingopyxis sp.]SBV34614.1 protein of unknown function [uncultured Sphingopyxis sp.]